MDAVRRGQCGPDDEAASSGKLLGHGGDRRHRRLQRLKISGPAADETGMDPDRRHERRTHARPEPHRLWWRPGDGHGRGILFDSGHVHTWPEGEGEHRHMARLRTDRPVMFFLIRPDGRVRIPRRHAAAAAELSSALRSADRRLQPFDPHAADA
jgi:hypothetical protein